MPKPQRRRNSVGRVLVPHVVAALVAVSVMMGVAPSHVFTNEDWCDLFPQWPGCVK